MAQMIRKYSLGMSSQKQSIQMPRRARVIYVCTEWEDPVLYAQVLEDADTKAFDVKHMRHFYCLEAGASVPEGAGYVGSCRTSRNRGPQQVFHIYESQ